MSIPYTYVAFAFALLVVFFKIGQLDEEIGLVIGLSAGILALILNHYWPRSYGGLLLHGLGMFALLTVYKIIQGHWQTRDSDQEEDSDYPGRSL